VQTILNLKEGQTVVVGQSTLMVIRVGTGKVKLGIVAPADVRVYRKETYDRITGGQDDSPFRPQQSAG
jgi:carbon storage regulator CsrA